MLSQPARRVNGELTAIFYCVACPVEIVNIASAVWRVATITAHKCFMGTIALTNQTPIVDIFSLAALYCYKYLFEFWDNHSGSFNGRSF
jgi:hypothetical protein